MKSTNIIYLASQSSSRARLLKQSKIPFKIIPHSTDESNFDLTVPLEQLTQSIAVSKLDQAQLPAGIKEDEQIFVLAADTMGQDQNSITHGKPKNKADAIAKLKALRHGLCCTSFCLERKRWRNNLWQTEQRIVQSVTARYEFHVPNEWIEIYLKEVPYMQVSGAIQVEGYGAQFLKIVEGSYSTILGLPLYELREALEKLNFF